MIFLLIALLCLVTQAFFSSSEIALVSANRADIRRLAQSGNKGARLVEEFLSVPERLLSITLLGTQLSVVTSTVVTKLWLSETRWAHHAELVLLLVLTPILITFGEIIPKAFVRHNAERVAPFMARGLYFAHKPFSPMVSLLVRLSDWGARRLGIDAHRKVILREELEHLVDVKEDEDIATSDVTEGERSMISRILDLSDVTVDEVMVPLSGISALPTDATVAQISHEIYEKKYSRIPIYKGRLDQIVGIVDATDVIKAGRSMLRAEGLMHTPIFIPESHKAIELLQAFQRTDESMAIVVDEYGGAVGIITQEDILEEIVGEIEDEYDAAPPSIQRQKDGSYCAPGLISIAQLNKELDLDLPESEEYETIAGLVLEQLKRIPRVGDEVHMKNVWITVCAATERKVEEVRIHRGMHKA